METPTKWKPTMCFYEPGSTNLADVATADNLGMYSGETLDQIRERYPTAQVMDIDEACRQADAARRAKYMHGPREITAERFEEKLGCLPPEDWKCSQGGESFKISERISGNLTAIFCQIGHRFFELCDDARNSHEWIVRECQKVIDAGKFKTGDRVTFTNPQGCVFTGKTIAKIRMDHIRGLVHHYTPTDSPWFGVLENQLTLET
jgi:hypothetical protein